VFSRAHRPLAIVPVTASTTPFSCRAMSSPWFFVRSCGELLMRVAFRPLFGPTLAALHPPVSSTRSAFAPYESVFLKSYRPSGEMLSWPCR
jgi:hypothetical protein